jgi:Lon protease-like protein
MQIMKDLPLFPLDTVLFPGMPLALHIFEERYKMMIGLCLQRQQPFGVVLIKEGMEALGPLAEPHLVGCTAQITQVERLDQGRMHINAVGRRRFRVLSISRDLPYLMAQAAYYPIQAEVQGVEMAAKKLRPWVLRYMDELARIKDFRFEDVPLPEDPMPLAYLAAALLRIPNIQKQELLTSVTAAELLESLRRHYKQEVAFLKSMVEHSLLDQGPFSLN